MHLRPSSLRHLGSNTTRKVNKHSGIAAYLTHRTKHRFGPSFIDIYTYIYIFTMFRFTKLMVTANPLGPIIIGCLLLLSNDNLCRAAPTGDAVMAAVTGGSSGGGTAATTGSSVAGAAEDVSSDQTGATITTTTMTNTNNQVSSLAGSGGAAASAPGVVGAAGAAAGSGGAVATAASSGKSDASSGTYLLTR